MKNRDQKGNPELGELSRSVLDIGHDLNNKLAAMVGSLEVLRLDQDIENRDAVEEILSVGRNARQLVTKLMELARDNSTENRDARLRSKPMEVQPAQATDRYLNLEDCPRGTEKILLVDDDISFLRAQSKQLLRLGYHVTISQNGQDAFEKLSADPERYALVITDQAMPEMTGLELAEKVANVNSSQKMMMLTGMTPSELYDRFHDAGFRRILQKPIDIVELTKQIRAELDDR